MYVSIDILFGEICIYSKNNTLVLFNSTLPCKLKKKVDKNNTVFNNTIFN